MRVISDFHIHSRFSYACSKNMVFEEIAKNGLLKGLDLIGTGDITQPVWFKEIKDKLSRNETEPGSGIFDYNGIRWMLTTELSTIYSQDGKTRKVHHVIHVPSVEVTIQMRELLDKHGKLDLDGRPTLTKITSPELVEGLMEISDDILIYPAHTWTSWFGVLGEFSGFNSIDECYGDQTKHVHAIETGMSSDPSMNWRIKSLDKFTILSNSDAHSPWVWRLGREANVFELDNLTYDEISDSIKKNDPKRLKYTIEVEPSYGKYHFTGHRKCEVNLSPSVAAKLGNICPVCKKKMTIGVMQRVEKLADRPEGYTPKGRIPFKSLIPLYEIISSVTGVNRMYSNPVIIKQDRLIETFGNELKVLLDASKADLMKATDRKIADAIIKIRDGKVGYTPGYDGVYGVPMFSEDANKEA